MARRFGAPRGPRIGSSGPKLPKGKRTLSASKLAATSKGPRPGGDAKAPSAPHKAGALAAGPTAGAARVPGPAKAAGGAERLPSGSSGAAKALKSAPKPGQTRKAAHPAKPAQFTPPKAKKAPKVLKAPKIATPPKQAPSGPPGAHGPKSPAQLSLVGPSTKSARPPGKLKAKAQLKASGPRTPKKLHPAFALHVRPPS